MCLLPIFSHQHISQPHFSSGWHNIPHYGCNMFNYFPMMEIWVLFFFFFNFSFSFYYRYSWTSQYILYTDSQMFLQDSFLKQKQPGQRACALNIDSYASVTFQEGLTNEHFLVITENYKYFRFLNLMVKKYFFILICTYGYKRG